MFLQHGQEPRRIEVIVPGEVRVSVPAGLWRVRLQAEGLWAAEEVLVVRRGDDVFNLRSWPVGSVQATLAAPPSHLPLTLDFAPPEANQAAGPRGQVLCAAVERLQFRCPVPAAVPLDLRLGARGHVPVYRFEQQVARGAVVDFGLLTLPIGASISGRVLPPVLAPESRPPQVLLRPRTESAVVGESLTRSALAHVQAQPNGFFQLHPVPAGDFVVTAAAPGLAPVSVAVTTVEGAESALRDPLRLEPPVPLAVVVSPPTDPEGKTWHLRLGERDRWGNHLRVAREGEVSITGSWATTALARGLYWLEVSRQDGGERTGQQVEVGVDPAPILVQMASLEVEGLVRLGRQALAKAELWFGSRHGASRAAARCDESGRFRLHLSRPGSWLVDVESSELQVRRRLRVEVPKPSGAVARVELTLPDTRVSGRVVDAVGKPQGRALVYAFPLALAPGDGYVSLRTQADGTFEFRGLPEGQVSLSAATAEGESEVLIVQVAEVHRARALDLVVEPRREVSVRVSAAGLPVPGAQVIFVPAPNPRRLDYDGATEPNGEARIALPATVTTADLHVVAPGYTLFVSRVQLAPGALLQAELTREQGTLEIAGWPRGEEAAHWTTNVRYLRAQVAPGVLETWARLQHGGADAVGTLIVPGLPPGEYEVCREPWGDALRPGNHRCTAGFLPPGGSLSLNVGPTGE